MDSYSRSWSLRRSHVDPEPAIVSPYARLPGCTHSLTSFRVDTLVPSPSDRKAGHADLIAPMSMTTLVAQSTGLILLLGLMLLAGVAACGPAPSDQAPSLESRASVAGPSELPALLPKNPSPHSAPLASNPASPLAEQQDEPAPLPEQLVLPQWIAQALDAPEVPVRLRVLDRGGNRGQRRRSIRWSWHSTTRTTMCARRRWRSSNGTGRSRRRWSSKAG